MAGITTTGRASKGPLDLVPYYFKPDINAAASDITTAAVIDVTTTTTITTVIIIYVIYSCIYLSLSRCLVYLSQFTLFIA